ncbi:MAG: GH1 family beta-glucosidase [Streptosporangiales bacterium]
MNDELPGFPADFLWGAATAAYQIEGAVDEDGRGPSIWDTFSHTPGAIAGGDTGDVACDHYHRYAEDVRLAADLGLGAYRYSIAWPRVLPTGIGEVNQAGLDFYKRLTDDLLAHGITPCVTLYHWDLPQLLEDKGGWAARDIVEWFGEYVGVVAAALGDRVPMWVTLNEPWVAAFMGYGSGQHAPGRTERLETLRVVHHFALAHERAVSVLRETVPATSKVGLTLNVSPAYPASDQPDDIEAARRFDAWLNWLFADAALRGRYPELQVADVMALGDWMQEGDLRGEPEPLDFLGLNYYQPMRMAAPSDMAADLDELDALSAALGFVRRPWEDAPRTMMGWPVVPDGLRETLVRFQSRYGSDLPPVYITENGVALPDAPGPGGAVEDQERIAFVDGHLRALRQAIDGGIDVRGYFYWSLLDNFEWAEGYATRFGLTHVDFETGRRTPKASYDWYRALIAGSVSS